MMIHVASLACCGAVHKDRCKLQMFVSILMTSILFSSYFFKRGNVYIIYNNYNTYIIPYISDFRSDAKNVCLLKAVKSKRTLT